MQSITFLVLTPCNYIYKRLKRKNFILFIICSILLLKVAFYFEFESSSDKAHRLIQLAHSRDYKVLQLLTQEFLNKTWPNDPQSINKLDETPFKACPSEKRCYLLNAFKSWQQPIEASDAILVHLPNLVRLPWKSSDYKRDQRQIWVLHTLESQARSFCSFHYGVRDLDDWFNLSVTFKPDSDLVMSYRPFRSWQSLPQHFEYMHQFDMFFSGVKTLDNYKQWLSKDISGSLTNRTAQVFWFVSNCRTRSLREDYANELQKYIDIDVYGGCDQIDNSKPDPCRNVKDESECYRRLYKSYRFYLAFENTQCNHYITEKFWKFYSPERLFTTNVVPVVRGARRDHYEQVAYAKRSFINVDDFESPEKLAGYLKLLLGNRTALAEYFSWKVDLTRHFFDSIKIKRHMSWAFYSPETQRESFLCELCSRLHDDEGFMSGSLSVKVSEWFNPALECWNNQPHPSKLASYLANFFATCI
jgi:alpha-1,3-fucosyltransferase